jgi:hypothetical protein
MDWISETGRASAASTADIGFACYAAELRHTSKLASTEMCPHCNDLGFALLAKQTSAADMTANHSLQPTACDGG